MATLIDFHNKTPEELMPLINSIQKRYLDPYTIRLTTKTNNYFFIETEINKITSVIYGNNVLVEGLNITNIQYFDKYVEIYVTKGIAICDSTIVEFTDDFILRVSKTDLDISDKKYNVIGIDYIHVQNYPPRVAFPFATNIDNTSSYNVSAVIGVFKTDGSSTTYLNPDDGKLVEDLEITINGTKFKILPSYGSIQNTLTQISEISGDTLTCIGYRTSKFDSSVSNGMLVYLNPSDGKFYPAIADGSEKSKVFGYADTENNKIIISGLIKTDYSFSSGQELYLSDSEPGKITTNKTPVKVGLSLGNGYIVLGSSISSPGSISEIPGDIVTFEDLEYYSLLLDSPFQDVYYDRLTSDSLNVISGSAAFKEQENKYIIQSNATLETDNLLNLDENDYRFLVHVDSTESPSNVEYSIDDGATWNSCEPDKIVTVSTGFKKIKFRFTFDKDCELNSYGILYHYGIPEDAYSSDTRMFEILNVDEDKPENTVITLPNGATYTPDGKSLEIYLNRARLIPNIDYEEVDNRKVKFKLPLHKDDTIVFTEKFGYVDVSEENHTKLQHLTPSWTDNYADYIVLRDQSTGKLYKIYIDNDNLKFESLE